MEHLGNRKANILSFTLLASTFSILPFTMLDPIILPRLMILTPITLFLLATVPINRIQHLGTSEKYSYLLFVLILITIASLGKRPFADNLFGEFRRGNGLIFWVTTLSIFLIFRIYFRNENTMKFLSLFWIATSSNAIYATFQTFNLDIIPWTTQGEPIGFLGNSNFLTSFVSLGAVSGAPLLLERKSHVAIKAIILAQFGLASYLVVVARSLQGLLVLILPIVLLWILKKRHQIKQFSKVMRNGSQLMIIGLLLLGIAPLVIVSNGTYSLLQRFDFMSTGLRVFLNFPIVGIGFDSFADYYPFFRSATASNRSGASLTDSAHNVLIDVMISGGILLLISILILCYLLAGHFISRFRVKHLILVEEACLLSLVFGFLIQSAISINHVVIASWSAAALGALISKQEVIIQGNSSKRVQESRKIDYRIKISQKFLALLFFVFSSTLVATAVFKDIEIRKSLVSEKPQKVFEYVNQWPQLKYHLVFPSLLLQEREKFDYALRLARKTIQLYPNDIDTLRILRDNPLSTKIEKTNAIALLARAE